MAGQTARAPRPSSGRTAVTPGPGLSVVATGEDRRENVGLAVEFEVFTSSFCGACSRTRGVLGSALRYLPGATVTEHAVETEPDRAEAAGIQATPTVIVRDPLGVERFRATGVPTIEQVLTAAVRVIDLPSKEPSP